MPQTQPDRAGLERRLAAVGPIAREAGKLALDYYRRRGDLAIEKKGPQDLVSEADRAVEDLIRSRLAAAFPEDRLVGEERGGSPDGPSWIIDPIDGTSNFLRGVPLWAVSIGFVLGTSARIGAIYAPEADELYLGGPDFPVTLNGQATRCAAEAGLGDAVLCFGYSRNAAIEHIITFLTRTAEQGAVFQALKCCSLSLAYVATGRLDGFFEARTNSWDCAAGLALVHGNGGRDNGFLAGPGLHEPAPLVAASAALWPQFSSHLIDLTGEYP